MTRRPPRTTQAETPFPDTTLFRSPKLQSNTTYITTSCLGGGQKTSRTNKFLQFDKCYCNFQWECFLWSDETKIKVLATTTRAMFGVDMQIKKPCRKVPHPHCAVWWRICIVTSYSDTRYHRLYQVPPKIKSKADSH